jgi:membrane-bound lytic murein transglycosylase D
LKKWPNLLLLKTTFSIVLLLLLGFANLRAQDNSLIESSEKVLFQSPVQFDYIPSFSDEEIQRRLESLSENIEMEYHERVKIFIDYFTVREREYTRMMAMKMNVYFPLFEKYLAKHGLPDELKYLAIVESGLNPRARSRVGAVGLWQFMPATGRSFKLYQNWYADDRMDPEKATEAACLYLKQLYTIFGDWHLALASYNAGPGNVKRAITRSGGKRKFWQVYNYLPRETRSYVPQFIAIAYTMNHLEEHNLLPTEMEYAEETFKLPIDQFVSLEHFANASGICLDDINRLNPSLTRGAIPDNASNAHLTLPIQYKEHLEIHLDTIMALASVGREEMEKLAQNAPGSTYGREKMVYRVASGDVLGRIAQNHNVRVDDLKAWNNLNSNLIRVGQNLNIWLPASGTTSRNVAQSVIIENGRKYHKVRPGDTLWDIAREHDLSIDELKKRNNLNTNNIRPGQRLIIG